MFIVLRTSIINKDGEEIYDTVIIAKTYLRGRFIVDFLSVVPFDKLALVFIDNSKASKLRVLSLLKLIRILRLNKIIMYLNVKKDIKGWIRLFKVVFFLMMYIHTSACIWFVIVSQDRLWIPPNQYMKGFWVQGDFFEMGKMH